MTSQKKYYIIFIIFITLAITYLHYSTIPEIYALHDIFREFYYIPVILGALIFGLKGAVLAYLLVIVLYMPYVFFSWTGNFLSEANKFLHLLLQGIFAFFTGFLVNSNKKHMNQLEKERYLAGIGQVATTIVHDLKNPLITILGFAKRIQEGKGKTDTAVQTIIDSAENMQRVVHNVLDFAKPIKLVLREEDMRNVINRASDACKVRAEGEGINLLINAPSDPVTISIDSFHMERAIINLVNNAIDASHKGQEVTLSVVPDKDYVAIAVEDQGSGMDRETIENIFIPFYTKKNTGTGLGMSIVKKIIDGHLGKINIRSRPGKGTKVNIHLPYRLKEPKGKEVV